MITQDLKSGNTQIDEALEIMENLEATVLPPLEWSEGLTKAAAEYAEAWSVEDDPSSLKKRLNKYGKFPSGAKYEESVYTYKTYSPDAIDFARFILTNGGDNAALAPMLFGATGNKAKKFGASWGVSDGCYMTVKNVFADPPQEAYSCDIVLVVIAASSYTNNSDVAKC